MAYLGIFHFMFIGKNCPKDLMKLHLPYVYKKFFLRSAEHQKERFKDL